MHGRSCETQLFVQVNAQVRSMVHTDVRDMDFIWQVKILHATALSGATWSDYTKQESSFIESAYQTGIFEEQGVPLPIGIWPPHTRVWVCNDDRTLYETTADTGNRREVRRLNRAM
jgi:hypothetical protein